MTTFLGKVEAKVGNTKDVEKAWKSLDAMMNAVMKACGIPKSEIVSEEEEEAQVPESTE